MESITIPALCLLFSVSVIVDTWATYDWLAQGGRESNPFWVNRLHHPTLVFTIDFSIMAGVSFAATEIGKKNKTIAIIGMVGLCLMQGYYLYRHYEVRRRGVWGTR